MNWLQPGTDEPPKPARVGGFTRADQSTRFRPWAMARQTSAMPGVRQVVVHLSELCGSTLCALLFCPGNLPGRSGLSVHEPDHWDRTGIRRAAAADLVTSDLATTTGSGAGPFEVLSGFSDATPQTEAQPLT